MSRTVTMQLTRAVGAMAAVVVLAAAARPGAAGEVGGPAPDDEKPVLVVAHRGASTAAPEHTGPAYDEAFRSGADVQECDLQVTADDQLVCVHDTTVDRTTGGAATGRVDSYTLAELREMDFGSWFDPQFAGARIVTLEEQITCYRAADRSMQFYVETKAPAEYGGRTEPLLVDLLERLDVVPEGDPDVRSSPVIVQSFDLDSLAAVRALAPSIPLAYLTVAPLTTMPGDGPDVEVVAISADVLGAQPEIIDAHHRADREVHTWTVDDPMLMERLVDEGVDGFFTNDPATGRKVVDSVDRGSGRRASEPKDASRQTRGCAEGLGIGIVSEGSDPSPPSDVNDSNETGAAGQPADTSGSGDDDTGRSVAIAALVIVGLGAAALVLMRRRAKASHD